MSRRPRDQHSPLLTPPLVVRILLVGVLLLVGSFGLFEWQLYQGESVSAARTATVNVLVFGELFYLFNCRSLTYSMLTLGVFSNQWLFFGVVGIEKWLRRRGPVSCGVEKTACKA